MKHDSLFAKKNVLFIGGLLIALLVFGIARPTFAQANTSQNITMSPASTLVSIKPGATIEKKFQILNSGGTEYTIVTSASPYHVVGNEYTPDFNQLPGTTDTAKWVQVLNPSATVDAQKSTDISYRITVPESTAPGGYYAVLFAETRPVGSTEKSGVVPRNRVGNILYITVEGAVKTSGDVTVRSAQGFKYQATIPIGFTISNTGGVHFLTTVKATVKSITGKTVYNSSIERYVLPQTQRDIPIDWSPTAPVGVYTVSRSAMVAGTERSLPDQTFVYVQPWVIVLAVSLLASIILYFSSHASARRNATVEKTSKK